MIEERFGPYTVYECIGTGGMATVHRATFDRGDGVAREVALKRLLPQHIDDKTFVDDFVREGQIASRLHHPGIVAILDLGRIGSTYFIAMELIHGQSMMQLIRKAHVAKTPAPIGVVIALISELCDALDYACNGNDTLGDRLNIIHRDLSPSNLLVDDEGHLRVIDFGVAKAITGRFATTTGLVKGKLGYMSAEALSGKPLDGRADVFSTGVVAWELLTGRRLFTGANELEVVQRVRSGVVPPPSSLNPACPPTLDSIVQQALARVREDRWSTAATFRAALESVRRAYREEATTAEVVRWRDAISAEPARATRPIAPPPMDSAEDPDEVTQHRAPPTSGKSRRAMTEIDLLDLEPPEIRAGADFANGEFPDSVSTFTGELAAHAFGGPTAPSATIPAWPIESATQLNVDAYAQEPSASYTEMSVSDEPEITFDAQPDHAHQTSNELEVLDLRPPPREEILDLEAAEPPREELLDLEGELTLPSDSDTVLVPSSHRPRG